MQATAVATEIAAQAAPSRKPTFAIHPELEEQADVW